MIVKRKFKSFINLLVFVLMVLVSILYSQDDCDISSFEIKEKLFNDGIVAYYLSAIDINSGTSYIQLFEYSIEGNLDCYNLEYPSNINFYFLRC